MSAVAFNLDNLTCDDAAPLFRDQTSPCVCWRWWPLFLGAGRTVGDARRRCVSCAAGRPDTRHAHAVPPAWR